MVRGSRRKAVGRVTFGQRGAAMPKSTKLYVIYCQKQGIVFGNVCYTTQYDYGCKFSAPAISVESSPIQPAF